ncbi:MAG: molybdenum cofactor guanylyltransferase [Solirubrobacteraceae bacterium]
MTAIVAVLAGGHGLRIGGDKAMASLAGRPLIEHPLSVTAAAGLQAIVVARPSTRLPLLKVRVLIEDPRLPYHPLSGVITALAESSSVVALPCDMPFVTPEALRSLADTDGELVLLAREHPFPGRYQDTLIDRLRTAAQAGSAIRDLLATARILKNGPPAPERVFFNVNTLQDLGRAERLISSLGFSAASQ